MKEHYHYRTGTSKKYLLFLLLIWVAQMAAAFYFCTRKQGFHEDEYYTYYSTARTNGFYVEDGQWMDRDTYLNEFVVLPDQKFQYGLVKQVQSWDVHPPVYYWVFHTVASLVPGVFSKWIGLVVNLFFFGVNIVLLAYLAYLISSRDIGMALLVTLFYGFCPAAMSGVVFIRMYEMLTTAVLLCAILHAYAVEKNEAKLSVARTLLPMAVVTYLGFLTQYYYFIFLFYLGIGFCAWLIRRDRNLWNCIRYGISQGVALVLAYLTYPACLGQMFRGQRGAQATENFFEYSNTIGRIHFFYELLDEYVFGKMLPVFLLLLLLLVVTVYRQKSLRVQPGKSGKGLMGQESAITQNAAYNSGDHGLDTGFWIFVFAAAGYFFTVSKTALLLGDTSNRYQLPVYGVIVLLIFRVIQVLCRRVVGSMPENRLLPGIRMKSGKWIYGAMAALCLLIDVAGLMSGRVVFLYPEDGEQVAYAQKRAKEGALAVYLYQAGEEWCIWDVSNELFAYPEVYFAAVQGSEMITDDRIRDADSLVVYLAKGVDVKEQIDRILGSKPEFLGGVVFEEKYCDVYYFSVP